MNKRRRRIGRVRARTRKRQVRILAAIRRFFDLCSSASTLSDAFHDVVYPDIHYVTIEVDLRATAPGSAP